MKSKAFRIRKEMTNQGKDTDKEGEHSRSWSNSFIACGPGETNLPLPLTPNKQAPPFGYDKGKGENGASVFSAGRGRVDTTMGIPNNSTSRSFSLGFTPERSNGAHGDPFTLRYSRIKLLDIFRLTDLKSLRISWEGFADVPSIITAEPLEPLALSAPISEELVTLKAIDKGDIVSSGLPQVSREGSTGKIVADSVMSKQPRSGAISITYGPYIERSKKQRGQKSTLPQHIIFSHILPFLPFKNLTRFKSVAKSWKKLISGNPLFALDQSRHFSPISCGAVFSGCHGGNLVYFSTFGSPIGIPNPSLDFVPGGKCYRIFNSANGLFCMQCYGDSHFFYICNAVKEEGHTIANDNTNGSPDSIGLAFFPRISTECYKLAHPLRCYRQVLNCPGVDYGFEVFLSDTNKWVESNQEIHGIGELWHHKKAVCADGVMYWDCETYYLSTFT